MSLTVEVASKVTASHLARDAYVYVRQSTPTQVREHTESLARQYELRGRAEALGWPARQVVVIDADLGRSGANTTGRSGFRDLVADVGLGKVGIVLGIEVSRLARNNADWYQLLDLCRGDRHADRRRGRCLPPGRLQRPARAGLEGHHERGGAASDPGPADRRVAAQGGQGRAAAGPAGRAGLRRDGRGHPQPGRGGPGSDRHRAAPLRRARFGPPGAVDVCARTGCCCPAAAPAAAGSAGRRRPTRRCTTS